jgi:two-component system OmpR family response regulator
MVDLLSRLTTTIAAPSMEWDVLRNLIDEAGAIQAELRQRDDWLSPGSGYAVWHQYVSNPLLALRGATRDAGQAQDELELARLAHGKGPQRLQAISQQMAETLARPSPDGFREVLRGLQAIDSRLDQPAPAPLPTVASVGKQKRWHAVVAEDDVEIWQSWLDASLSEAAAAAQMHGIELTWEMASDTTTAESRIVRLASSTPGTHSDQRDFGVLAIIDLCMPVVAEEPDTRSRTNGMLLVERARSEGVDVPVIVFAQAADFLSHHLRAYLHGVSSFLLKDSDTARDDLVEEILRTVTAAPTHVLRMPDVDRPDRVWVDGVAVSLSPMQFAVLSHLVTAFPRPARVWEIVGELIAADDDFARQLGAEDSVRRKAQSISLAWSEAKRDAGDTDAVHAFIGRLAPILWRNLEAELDAGGLKGIDTPRLHAYLETHYGNVIKPPPYSDQTVFDAISGLRRSVKLALDACGRQISPATELVITCVGDEDVAYRLRGSVETQGAIPQRHDPSLRVLIVEDSPEWQAAVRDILGDHGYEVRVASTVEEARSRVAEWRPDLLCLDLVLPCGGAEGPETERMPGFCGGVALLRHLRRDVPDLRTVVLSDRADDDSARAELEECGLSASDFVPKGSADWAGELLWRAYRAWRAIHFGEITPFPGMRVPVPYLRFPLRDERINLVEVNGRPWCPSQGEYAILRCLAQAPFEVVEISAIEASTGRSGNALELAVSRLRRKIAAEWYGVSDKALAGEIGRRVIVTTKASGYMLNARVACD